MIRLFQAPLFPELFTPQLLEAVHFSPQRLVSVLESFDRHILFLQVGQQPNVLVGQPFEYDIILTSLSTHSTKPVLQLLDDLPLTLKFTRHFFSIIFTSIMSLHLLNLFSHLLLLHTRFLYLPLQLIILLNQLF